MPAANDVRSTEDGAAPIVADDLQLQPRSFSFVVAVRPALMDIYAEYAQYHGHQLDKGWKS